MSDNLTITAANSIFTITVPGLFPSPVQLSGYASDDAFATDAVELAEVQMGVDGRLTGGYVPNPVKQAIKLQADSPSKAVFAAIIQATKSAREIFWMQAEIVLPSTGEKFVLTRGVLSAGKQIADAKKVLQPLDYTITWQSVDLSPM